MLVSALVLAFSPSFPIEWLLVTLEFCFTYWLKDFWFILLILQQWLPSKRSDLSTLAILLYVEGILIVCFDSVAFDKSSILIKRRNEQILTRREILVISLPNSAALIVDQHLLCLSTRLLERPEALVVLKFWDVLALLVPVDTLVVPCVLDPEETVFRCWLCRLEDF